MGIAQLEAAAVAALARWPEKRAEEIGGPLLRQAVNELFWPLGKFAEDNLCDLEGCPQLPVGPLTELEARYELYREQLP
jgi:hypothetical protein